MVSWLLVLALVGQASAGQSPAPERLVLLDDRGHPLLAPVEVCFQLALRGECRRVTKGVAEFPSEDFRLVRIEGKEHGPRSARREELAIAGDRGATIRVPRKALLRILGTAREPLTLSLYAIDDESFRRPAVRASVPPAGVVLLPAGRWLASLARPGSAPDLHLLSIAPAASTRLRYRSRAGWSAVVRCRSAATGRPVSAATVALRGAVGFERGGERTTATGDHGLALFSGIEHELAAAGAHHPGFVPRELPGVAATPGTFTFEDAPLERGGGFRATVTAGKEPVTGARCRLLDFDRETVRGRRAERAVVEATTSASGRCAAESGIAAGQYLLRVALTGEPATAESDLEVRAGEISEAVIELTLIRLSGRITVGGRPAAGWRVEVSRNRAPSSSGTSFEPVAELEADDGGEYEGVLWARGEYTLMPLSPSGTPSVHFRMIYLEAAEETVDLEVPAAAVRGVVIDEESRPIAAARVSLKEERMVRVAETGATGEFDLPVEAAGVAALNAFKPGYVLPEPVEIVIPEGGSPPPVTLRMRRSGVLRGVVTSGGGAIAGAWVAAMPAGRVGAAPRFATSDAAGRFEVELPQFPGRLFFAGPGCALTTHEVVTAAAESIEAVCAAPAAGLVLLVRDAEGKPASHVAVRLRRGSAVVPHAVLATHLAALGLPPESDGAGRLALVALGPGTYDLFLADRSSEESIVQGAPNGFVAAVELAPLAVTELEIAMPPR